jgi:hypothetical protein
MPTPEREKKLCIFRQAFDMDDPNLDLQRGIETPQEFICKVGGCAIKGQNLLDYAYSSGTPGPREVIDSVVAPSCAILDVVTPFDQFVADTRNEFGDDIL